MVDPEPNVKQLAHLLVSRLSDVPSEKPVAGVILATELVQATVNRGGFFEGLGSLDCLLPGVYEHHHLMTQPDQLRDLLEGHPIEIPARLYSSRFSSYTDEMLLQRDRSERGIEKEETSIT